MFDSKYGITSIVSERRSGMTTILNEFIKKNIFDKKILVISCNKECAKKTCVDVIGNKNIEYDSDKQLIHKLINEKYDIIISIITFLFLGRTQICISNDCINSIYIHFWNFDG